MSLFEKSGLELIKSFFSRNKAVTQAQVAEIPTRTNKYGREYKITAFSEVELAEDDLVNLFVDNHLELQAQLADFKKKSWDSLFAYLSFVFEHYQVTYGGYKQGSMTFTSLNQLRKVMLTYEDMIKTGSALLVAKELLDQIIEEKSEHVDSDTQQLLKAQLYLKNGSLSISGLLSLRNMKLSHPHWVKIQALIADGLKPVGKKGYIRVYQRASRDPKDNWQQISIDYSAL